MRLAAVAIGLAWLLGCGEAESEPEMAAADYRAMVEDYVPVQLEADLSGLSERQRAMLPLLIRAAKVMDGLFWKQAYGDKEGLLAGIADPHARTLAEINYGPWDRLGGNRPLFAGFGPKPAGANFYPPAMTKDEFERAAAAEHGLRSLDTLVRRSESGSLVAVPYHVAFGDEVSETAGLLRDAAGLAEDSGFRRYLEMRADALESGDYQPSDFAWMDMRDNAIDLVIGPIETYEDRLFGTKAAFEAYVLVKDKEWSRRLERYSAMLPDLQNGLPVPEEYKAEEPGTGSQLNAYDVLYYAGDCNAGAKTIAINLPNDEQVQLEKGSRRLQLKNAMRAKFDHILLPIADMLIDERQREKINFDSFFANTMFHEVAHGLGIKNTLDGKGTVREALRESASALEEAKADILGLHLVGRLTERGEIPDGDIASNYITYLAGIFRSVRFGTSSAHGAANTLALNYFERADAFSRDSETGTYRVNLDEMRAAVDALSGEILQTQGDGQYERAKLFLEELGGLSEAARTDLARIEEADIPVDVVFDQTLAESLLGGSR